MGLVLCVFVFIILLINMRRVIDTVYIFHSVFFDPLLGHDFLHVYKIISVNVAMRWNLMVYTRLCSAQWKCPKSGKIALWF